MIPLHDDNPTTIRPVITIGLIVVNTLVFLWEVSLGPEGMQRLAYSLGTIPAVLLQGQTLPPELALVPAPATVFTAMFLHGGWMHLIGNMLFLWIFGNNVEDAMGHARFIVFYLAGGVGAALGQAIMDPSSTVPMIGASGAISGVLGAYLLLHPHARVLVLIPLGIFTQLVRLPAMWVLGFWFVFQILNSVFATRGQGGVAWFAHVGGFAFGLLLIPFFKYPNVPLYNPFRHGGGHRR